MNSQLPIIEIIPEIKAGLLASNTLILQASPGAGKSTYLPLQLLNETWLEGKKIVMLEPRRLAAKTVAARLAFQLEEEVGATIGYRIRFENKISKATRLEILTEGILTRMLQQNDALEDVGLVIFDEFHERSLHVDLALALCREVQSILRPDLRILIMSATLDGEKLSALLNSAPVIRSKGREFPITFHYAGHEEKTPLPIQMSRLIKRAISENAGDVLAFFPGAGEISRTAELLENDTVTAKIVSLFGDMPIQQQQEAILPDKNGARKIVLATSIAETSLTIEGIKIVVDSGYSRVPRFDTRSGLTRLETIRVTKDAADQRAGRAGRTSPGVCYRLWTEGFNHHLIPHRSPEILEADLAPLVLELANWGTRNIQSLTWLSPPPAGTVSQAKELLTQLSALSDEKITARGKEMLRLPTHPRIAHLLTEAIVSNQSLAADIAALLEERDPLPKDSGADLVLRIEVLRKFRNREFVNADRKRLERVERIAQQWRKLLNVKPGNAAPVHSETGKLLAAAYPERIAKRESGNKYRLGNGRIAKLNETDELSGEEWIAIAELEGATTKESKIFLAAALDPDDIRHLAIEKKILEWDHQKGELIARMEKRVGDVILESKIIKNISEEERISILLQAVHQNGHELLNWTEEIKDLLARISAVKKWHPDEEWPETEIDVLLSSAKEWLSPYLSNVKRKDDFRKLDLLTILTSIIPWEKQQQLEKSAPQKITVPSGSHIRLVYSADGNAPVLAVRLQEIFGMLETPSVNEGRTKLMVHLLSPAYRPVQVTQDLQSFWKNTYPEVRKELRMRYPKHSWPEDPYTAIAVRGAKKRK
ncbi:MAG: ATP-dependent helicase HrpB [Bacteroidia bacterium]